MTVIDFEITATMRIAGYPCSVLVVHTDGTERCRTIQWHEPGQHRFMVHGEDLKKRIDKTYCKGLVEQWVGGIGAPA